jgi:hypothetical protein
MPVYLSTVNLIKPYYFNSSTYMYFFIIKL